MDEGYVDPDVNLKLSLDEAELAMIHWTKTYYPALRLREPDAVKDYLTSLAASVDMGYGTRAELERKLELTFEKTAEKAGLTGKPLGGDGKGL